MIGIQEQEEMFIAIGNALPKKVIVFAIGGTGMMLRSLKNSTLDVDFVFNKTLDRDEFVNALRKLGAKEYDATITYGLKNNAPLMLEFNNCRFDLFMNKIITSQFSEAMKQRSLQTHEFGNLIIKVSSSEDIIIMKSATSRDKDLDDITSIINKVKIDWGILVEESKVQVKLGNEKAIMELGEKLEKLNNQKRISVQKEILDKLWSLLKKQVKKKGKKK